MKEMRYIVKSKAVFTGNADRPEPAAILVQGKRIEKLLPWDFATESYHCIPVYDYGEKMIMPSFIDGHTHLFSGAVNASDYVCNELGKGSSQAECVAMIKAFAETHPDYKRIRGTGWFISNWGEEPLPDKRSLDEAVPDRPVYLFCADCHSMWLNSKALEEARIDPELELPNGENVKLENGELSGLLLEPAAFAPAQEQYMDFSEEEMKEIHQNFQRILAENGIAAVSEMFADDYTEDSYRKYDVLKKLDEEEGLKAQVFVYTKLFGYTEFSKYFKMKESYDSEHFHIAGVKGFIDGVTETYTGLLLEPYTDRPETCGDGLPLWPKERMQQEIVAANKAGIQVRLHCIGDGAVRMGLDLYEESNRINGIQGLLNTIEHIENIHPDDLDRFKELQVIPSMQPYHVTLSNNGKVHQIGKERCKLEFPIKTILEHGGEIAISTDYPVVTLNPFKTIYAAVTRKDDVGNPTSQNPWEKLPMETVLKAYTKGSARIYHMEQEMGTLEEGKLADFSVLSKNLFEIEEAEIPKIQVEANYFEGKRII